MSALKNGQPRIYGHLCYSRFAVAKHNQRHRPDALGLSMMIHGLALIVIQWIYERRTRRSLALAAAADRAKREIWITGTASKRAQTDITTLGWTLFQRANAKLGR